MRAPEAMSDATYRQELTLLKGSVQKGMFLVLLAVLMFFPAFPFASDYWLRIMVDFSITILAVLGLNILTGYCGQGSIAQAAFMAGVSYCSVILTEKMGLPFWVALPCSGLYV